MRDLDELFVALSKSKFRSRFRLKGFEADYLEQKGLSAVLEHARDFIIKRLAPANPKNDGRQTPMKKHPAFIAQHATATCCRSCLEKWHNIQKGKSLSQKEIEYIVSVISYWLKNQNI
ncbi:MAG: DUF4186 domain-containing protein [Planctomycetota bacterium]|jgi:hypothetical protein